MINATASVTASEYAPFVANLPVLVDPTAGIVKSVKLFKLSEQDPDVFAAYAEPADTKPLWGTTAANEGGACAVSSDRAVVRACGELVERYCSSYFRQERMPLEAEANLSNRSQRFVSVRDLYPFAPYQYDAPGFPFDQTDKTSPMRWVDGQSYLTSASVWIPASCVYVPYSFNRDVEPFSHMSISTGLAAGACLEDCVTKGIMEILERDSLMIIWHRCMPTPRVEPTSCRGLQQDIDKLLDYAKVDEYDWHINCLTLDVPVPVFSAMIVNKSDPPLTSFGVAADLNPVTALRNAMEEAALSRILLNRWENLAKNPAYVHKSLRTLRDHLFAHATDPRLRPALDLLVETPTVKRMADLIDEFDCHAQLPLTKRLESVNLEPVFVDVTTDDIAELGIRVCRTVIPGTQPLDNDHQHRYEGGNRLWTVPARLGLEEQCLDGLNPMPHPFP